MRAPLRDLEVAHQRLSAGVLAVLELPLRLAVAEELALHRRRVGAGEILRHAARLLAELHLACFRRKRVEEARERGAIGGEKRVLAARELEALQLASEAIDRDVLRDLAVATRLDRAPRGFHETGPDVRLRRELALRLVLVALGLRFGEHVQRLLHDLARGVREELAMAEQILRLQRALGKDAAALVPA